MKMRASRPGVRNKIFFSKQIKTRNTVFKIPVRNPGRDLNPIPQPKRSLSDVRRIRRAAGSFSLRQPMFSRCIPLTPTLALYEAITLCEVIALP